MERPKWTTLTGELCGEAGSGVAEREPSSFFLTLVTGPRRSLSPELSDTGVYEPQVRARLVTAAHFCEVLVFKLTPERQAGSSDHSRGCLLLLLLLCYSRA